MFRFNFDLEDISNDIDLDLAQEQPTTTTAGQTETSDTQLPAEEPSKEIPIQDLVRHNLHFI